MKRAETKKKALLEALEKIANIKHLNPVEFCDKYGHSDQCVCLTSTEIWWKCKNCGRSIRQECGLITV